VANTQHREAGVAFETILYEEDGPIGWLTLNRPEDGNMVTATMCHEIRDCINAVRSETRTRVLVITGAGEKFFCLGGRKEGMPETRLYAGVLPTLEIYESIDRLQKPVIASVNGFAVGGGNVLQVVCDLTIAKASAIFRQVGPMMGSFDAGYGTWYLEDLVGKKQAKELWYLNPKITAPEALEMGLINRVVPDEQLRPATRALALEVAERGAFALAAIKGAFQGTPRRCCRPRAGGARSPAAPVSGQRGSEGAGRGVRRAPQARSREVRPLRQTNPQ
jgi:naphthoate synthase